MSESEEKIEKIVKIMTYLQQKDYKFSFGAIDLEFDPNCPNQKLNKGYNNITKDEYRKAYNIFKNLLKSNLVKNLPAGYMKPDFSKGEYPGNFGTTCCYYNWIEK